MEILDIETSKLIVLQGSEGNSYQHVWSLFDVSPTTTQRFMAVHWEAAHPNEKPWIHGVVVVFDDVHDLIVWAVVRKEEGAEFRGGTMQKEFQGVEYLDKLVQSYHGLDSFSEVCSVAGIVAPPLCEGCQGIPCLPCRR